MGDGSILVITERGDLHADALRAVLQRDHGIAPLQFDLRDFPQDVGRYRLTQGSGAHFLAGHDLDNVRSVWWRRPHPSQLPMSLSSSENEFRQSECDGFIQGLLWSLPALWVNDPTAERRASRKVVQLQTAMDVGLAVPETLITNDPDEAAAFISARPARVIYKRTGTSPGEFCETRLITSRDLGRLNSIRSSPTTFQDYVDAKADLRVVWIAGHEWTVRIDSQSGVGRVDSRLDNSVVFSPYELPDCTSASLAQLMNRLGLTFGVLDLRLGSDGRVYFLEVNPQGQFAYLEIKTGLPIFRSLASLLADHRN